MYDTLTTKYINVFAIHTNTLPKTMNKVKPHIFKFKPGAKPIYEPRPNFSFEKFNLLCNWLEWAISVNLVEPARNTVYASRLHVVAKRKGNTPKSAPPDGIRVT